MDGQTHSLHTQTRIELQDVASPFGQGPDNESQHSLEVLGSGDRASYNARGRLESLRQSAGP